MTRTTTKARLAEIRAQADEYTVALKGKRRSDFERVVLDPLTLQAFELSAPQMVFDLLLYIARHETA